MMDIENLQIWKLGVKLAKDVYLLTGEISEERNIWPD